ncbi:hypothetical protein BHE74_00005924 [Ensete ventricosum]|nr:hypothetical protein BHE74_00005924 [Ensete ventricosum]RZR84585.1 hypothetical protein BHM03_00011438 [Ensete ventricosum]
MSPTRTCDCRVEHIDAGLMQLSNDLKTNHLVQKHSLGVQISRVHRLCSLTQPSSSSAAIAENKIGSFTISQSTVRWVWHKDFNEDLNSIY